jgi:two-component system sensor histidine kinase/response regulator
MGLLANLKLRRKLLVALTPLVVIVIFAGSYAALESKRIDTWYSQLIENELKAVENISAARALNGRYGLLLYRLIAETDPVRMQILNAELDKTCNSYRTSIASASRLYPAYDGQVSATSASFEKVVLDSAPVRVAALGNDKQKALNLMRSGIDDEMEKSRLQAIDLAAAMQQSVDQRSDELTRLTHRSIVITWLVIGFGLLASLIMASYLLHVEVVRELLTVRDTIQAIAAGDLGCIIPYLNRANEIGEIGRSLHTLQEGARERETQSWIKAEVATTAVRLQSAEDFGSFASALLSRLSESIPLLYGSFYLADDSQTKASRVGHLRSRARTSLRSLLWAKDLSVKPPWSAVLWTFLQAKENLFAFPPGSVKSSPPSCSSSLSSVKIF